jgi:hypothetical protein
MLNPTEKRLLVILAYEEYVRLLSERSSFDRVKNSYCRGNKQDRLIEIEKNLQLTQSILEKLEEDL